MIGSEHMHLCHPVTAAQLKLACTVWTGIPVGLISWAYIPHTRGVKCSVYVCVCVYGNLFGLYLVRKMFKTKLKAVLCSVTSRLLHWCTVLSLFGNTVNYKRPSFSINQGSRIWSLLNQASYLIKGCSSQIDFGENTWPQNKYQSRDQLSIAWHDF